MRRQHLAARGAKQEEELHPAFAIDGRHDRQLLLAVAVGALRGGIAFLTGNLEPARPPAPTGEERRGAAEAHPRELPEHVQQAACTETDPDRRILSMLAARGKAVAKDAAAEIEVPKAA